MKDLRNLEPEDYLRMFWKRRWYFFITSVLVSSAVSVYAWRMPDVYRSETTILIESPLVSEDYIRPTIRASVEERINMVRQLVESRSFLERMVEEFQLFGSGTRGDFRMDGAVGTMRASIEVVNTSSGTFVLSFKSVDPQFARNMAKRLAEELIRSSSTSRTAKALETDQFFDEQLRQAQRELVGLEEKIKQFKIAHLGELPEQSGSNLNALSGLNSQLASAEAAVQNARERRKLLDFRIQENKRLEMLSRDLYRTAVSPPSKPEKAAPRAPGVNPNLAAKQAELAQMTARYTSKHPDVVRLQREVEDLKSRPAPEEPERIAVDSADRGSRTEPEAVAARHLGADELISDLTAAEARVEAKNIDEEIARRERERDNINKEIKIYQMRLNIAPTLEQEYLSLSREYDVLKRQYSDLQSKKFGTQMTATLETSKRSETYKIIEEASLPERPAYPNRTQIALIGLGAGIGLGLGAAFGREILDPTLETEDETVAVLNLPVLVSIPEISLAEANRRSAGGPHRRIA